MDEVFPTCKRFFVWIFWCNKCRTLAEEFSTAMGLMISLHHRFSNVKKGWRLQLKYFPQSLHSYDVYPTVNFIMHHDLRSLALRLPNFVIFTGTPTYLSSLTSNEVAALSERSLVCRTCIRFLSGPSYLISNKSRAMKKRSFSTLMTCIQFVSIMSSPMCEKNMIEAVKGFQHTSKFFPFVSFSVVWLRVVWVVWVM